ncbi:MAG: zinc-binding dehydrogenase, partial [Burkholderiales bacterium]
GPPDLDFAKDMGSSWIPRQVMRLLSYRIRSKAKRRGVTYSFLFMRASGDHWREIGSLIESGTIRPVVDRVFPFESTKDAMAYVEKRAPAGRQSRDAQGDARDMSEPAALHQVDARSAPSWNGS